MGGHKAGEVASRFVLSKLSEGVETLPLNEKAIDDWLNQANDALYDFMSRDIDTSGMGTTIAGILISPDELAIFNVGDSRIYRWDRPFFYQISVDDISEKHDFGSNLQHKQSGAISQSFGGTLKHNKIAPHIFIQKVHPKDTYLICSDGLTDMIDSDELEVCMSEDLTASAKKLLDAAMGHGGNDNISIILVTIQNTT